ncbi:MAG: hypothetical protein E7022_11150 [Desulfovibrio desulfuricans]|jgi:hypothetical protein|nr:hypothetical protein [Desulfovibrio desulfuricans]
MMVWLWVALGGATLVAAIIFSVRLRKRGTASLEDDRERARARIRRTEEEIFEEQNRMTSGEHLHIARAGLEDLLRLAGNPPQARLEMEHADPRDERESALALHLPGEVLHVGLSMRTCRLRGGKMVRQRATWHLQGAELHEEYADLASLMHAVSLRLASALRAAGGTGCGAVMEDPADEAPPELPHFARRFAHAAAGMQGGAEHPGPGLGKAHVDGRPLSSRAAAQGKR